MVLHAVKSDKYKYIILFYPKSGCTTLRLMHIHLNYNPDSIRLRFPGRDFKYFEDYHHIMYDSIKPEELMTKYRHYYVISVYRNTYHRICSMFYQKFLGVISLNNYYNNQFLTQPKVATAEMNSFADFLKAIEEGTISDFHFCNQEHSEVHGALIDKKMEITEIGAIFSDHDPVLNAKVQKLMKDKNLNHRNRLKKYTHPKLDAIGDLSHYDFFADELGLLKDWKRGVPAYKYLLANHEVIDQINRLYARDFEYYPAIDQV